MTEPTEADWVEASEMARELGEFDTTLRVPTTSCDVYWGSHGCHLARGHEGHHFCCCDCDDHEAVLGRRVDDDGAEWWCVGTWPYYGDTTKFTGDDAPDPSYAATLPKWD